MDILIRLEIIVWIVLACLLLVTPIIWFINAHTDRFKQARQHIIDSIHSFYAQAKHVAELEKVSTSAAHKKELRHPQEQEDQETKMQTTSEQTIKEKNVLDEKQHENKHIYEEKPVVDTIKESMSSEEMVNQDEAAPSHMTDKEDDSISHSNNASQDAIKKHKKIETIKFAAMASHERGNKEQYEKKLIEGLAIDPDNMMFLKMLGSHYFETLQDVKALTILKKIVNIEPDDHKAIWQIGQIYRNQGQHDTAQLLTEKALSLKNDHPKYYITLVEIHYDNGNIQQAIQTMEKLLKLRPTNTDYLLTMATLYEEDKKPTLAAKYFSKVLEIDPSNNHAKKGLKRVK